MFDKGALIKAWWFISGKKIKIIRYWPPLLYIFKKNCLSSFISIVCNSTASWAWQRLTGWVLHFHHQSLEGIQGLKLLLLVTQVFLQQTGPSLKLLGIQIVPVAIWDGHSSKKRFSPATSRASAKWCWVALTAHDRLTNGRHQRPHKTVRGNLSFVQVSLNGRT